MGVLLAFLTALACVLIHVEALRLGARWAAHRHRIAVLLLWSTLLTAHALQIGVYAAAYSLGLWLDLGQLGDATSAGDLLYFSATVYTTVGFGDIVPTGSLRYLTATEGLVGLCLIAWSATVSYAHSRDLLDQSS